MPKEQIVPYDDTQAQREELARLTMDLGMRLAGIASLVSGLAATGPDWTGGLGTLMVANLRAELNELAFQDLSHISSARRSQFENAYQKVGAMKRALERALSESAFSAARMHALADAVAEAIKATADTRLAVLPPCP